MSLKNILFTLLLFSVTLGIAQDCPVFPHPQNYTSMTGEFYFGEMVMVSTKDLPMSGQDYLKWYLPHDLKINTLFVAEGGDVLFQRLTNAPPDSYSIKIDKKIKISYSSDASLFYAFQTLRQLILKNEGQYYLQNVTISDEPNFQYRGMHLDVSRHFFTVEEVKKYLDWMARYKFNKFHWHLTDDQGWRIEIKRYPKLTEIGSVRAQTLKGHASVDPQVYDGIEHKGFYTQKQIKEIVAYAADLFIEVIPEIEMPGHARAALAAYPEYSCDGVRVPVAETWGVFEKVFCSKDETITFLQNILSEVVELFPGKYIHIGGDEAPKTAWKACDNCQLQMEKHNLKNEEQLQSFFIKEMDKFLQGKGKTLIGWDEILEGGLSQNAVVMSWRGIKGGIEAAEQDHMVIMTPGSHCYFDHYQSDRKGEPLAIGGYTTLEKVYSFQPIPEELRADKQGLIIGAQANLWTEYIDNFEQVEYMILPRMIALSEVLWGTNQDYATFLNRLETHEFPRLKEKKANFSTAALYMTTLITSSPDGVEVSYETIDPAQKIDIDLKSDESLQLKDGNTVVLKKTLRPRWIKIKAKTVTGTTQDTSSLHILQHSTLGESWTITPSPSTYYPGKGALTLSDGVIGARPWNGKEWLGFNEGDVQLKFDLNNKKLVNDLNISMLSAPSSWIYLPETISLRYSKNGKKWKTLESKVDKELMKISLGKKTRYLEVTINCMDNIPEGQNGAGHMPWLFMDEIWLD